MNDGLTFSEYIRGVIPKKYEYTNVSDFIDRKGKFYDKKLWTICEQLVNDVFDLEKCSVSALRNYWGRMYNVQPQYTNKNDGTVHVLTDEEYRMVVKIKAFCSCWDGTTYQLNAWLRKLFLGRGSVFASDVGGMDISYTFFFQLENWELSLFRDYDILPRNAGCGHTVAYVSSDVFGFYGSELHPFDQRPFNKY